MPQISYYLPADPSPAPVAHADGYHHRSVTLLDPLQRGDASEPAPTVYDTPLSTPPSVAAELMPYLPPGAKLRYDGPASHVAMGWWLRAPSGQIPRREGYWLW